MTTLRADTAQVEARSASLRRELGVADLALSIAGLIGVGKQKAFQLLWNASAIFLTKRGRS